MPLGHRCAYAVRRGLLPALLGLAACSGSPHGNPAPAAAPPAGRVDAQRLANTASEPEQWLSAGRDAGGTYYSPLSDINASNVAHLGLAWEYRLGTHRGLEATPLVIDGRMYTTGNFGRVYALDAASGRELWTYNPGSDGQWGRYACCDAVNRGVAVWQGRVYVAALDGWLHAIDAASGQRVWKADTLPARSPRQPYSVTGAPLIAGESIVIGSGGGDFAGGRGYVAAYDLESGAFRWRFYTVPRDPREGPQDQPHLVAALASWDPRHRWEAGSGGAVWDGMAYDPALNLVYIGTGNGGPYNIKEGGRRGGDDLYAASIVAIHADSGSLAWYFQTVPADRWDFDNTQKIILADIELKGRTRQVLMQAPKNGFYYLLDRRSGELLGAQPYAFVNWTRGIDAKTGRPIPNPGIEYVDSPKLVFPSATGGHNWQPMSFDPATRLVYIPVVEAPNVLVETSRRRAGLVEGWFTVFGFPPEGYDPVELRSLYGELPSLAALAKGIAAPPRSLGFLRAWDPQNQRLAWEVPTASAWDGGVLSTGGGLVFQGDRRGDLNVYAAATGERRARVSLYASILAAPMTYKIATTQYVAVMAGYGGGIIGTPYPVDSAAYRYGNEGRIIVLKLDGTVPVPPVELKDEPFPVVAKPSASAATIGRGEVLYNRYCSRCHAFGRGLVPDLRRMTPATAESLPAIVLNGAYVAKGMGRFDDVLTGADVAAIRAYVQGETYRASHEQHTP